MLRFCFVILISLPFILFYLGKAGYIERHDEKYTEEERNEVARRAVSIMQRNGLIHTDVYGTENLPKDGGYAPLSQNRRR